MLKLFRENVRIALGSIKTQLLRTILTVMIIALGILALVNVLTVVAAFENTLSANFLSMGANTFNIMQYDASEQMQGFGEERKPNPIISYSEARQFAESYNYPFTQTSIAFTATTAAEIRFESKKTDPETHVLGVDDVFLGNSGLELSKGRNFTPFDISNNTPVCIIGSDLEKGLLKDVSPLDKIISVRGAKFRIIGVLKEKGSTFGNNQDLRVLLPIQVARSLFTQPNINYSISVLSTHTELLDQAVDNATIAMRRVRKLNPIEADNFGISRSDDLMNRLVSIMDVLGIAAWIIGAVTILGSSIALMNIMLVSVTERTREIGVRKALGAKKNTIAVQFFIETLVISQIGGLIGMAAGISIGAAISAGLDFAFVIPWSAMLAAFLTAFFVAIVSGLYPALKASNLDPIEALRYE